MHHFTFNEKYHEVEPQVEKSEDISRVSGDITSSLDDVSYRRKTNFRSSITDDAGPDKRSHYQRRST